MTEAEDIARNIAATLIAPVHSMEEAVQIVRLRAPDLGWTQTDNVAEWLYHVDQARHARRERVFSFVAIAFVFIVVLALYRVLA
jgi:t-SNARE complex subunit (syntaxin)